MGRSQADKAVTHQRIVNIASRRFRERGLDGIGVAEIMMDAGLTVGGFYKHFGSRDDLVVEALAFALTDIETWADEAKVNLRRAVRLYLCPEHRDNLASACPLSIFANDVSRSSDASRSVFTDGLSRIVASLESSLGEMTAKQRRRRAMVLISACTGALALSRSVSDDALSRQLLREVAEGLIELVVA